MTSIAAIPAPSSADVPAQPASKKKVEIEDAANMLLPGLLHTQSLLNVAIQVLSRFASPSPSALSHAEAAVKIRRLLDEFGHPAATRR